MELSVKIKKTFDDFSLDVEFHTTEALNGLLGSSGAGKSMILHCIAGSETPDAGRIVLNRRVLFDSDKGINLPSRLRRVGVLFQSYALFPHMTVMENIAFPLNKLSSDSRDRRMEEMLEILELTDLKERYPSQLSGGQQQRTALARALVVQPEALLLDEPFSALDDSLKNSVIKQLVDVLHQYQGITFFVTHNTNEAYRICSHLVILRNGHVEAAGGKEAMFTDPPTLSAARLTGFRNFSEIRRISSDKVYAADWNAELYTESPFPENPSHLTIRSHHLRYTEDPDEKNLLSCWLNTVEEEPFRVICYLTLGHPPRNPRDYHLQWDLSKERWNRIKSLPEPWSIQLPREQLRFIRP